jgi:hypothetical protein
MATLPNNLFSPTVDLIYSTYKNSPPRPHLGASQIGAQCERALWYSYHHCKLPAFSGRMLRLFETGKREEERIIRELRRAGVYVCDLGNDGNQIRFEMFGGRFAGSIDGMVVGIPEAPKTPHLLEIKTANDKSYKQMLKNGVEHSKPLHYAQMQVYMGAVGLKRALYIVVNKNTDEIYSERIELNSKIYKQLIDKAERIVTSDFPLERCESFSCRFCDFKAICEWDELPDINCRCCCHFGKCEQETVCTKHLWNPHLIPVTATDASEDDNWILYENGVKNGGDGLSSQEIKDNYKKLFYTLTSYV